MRDLEFIRGSPRHPAISGDLRRSPWKWSQEPLVGGPLPTRHGQDDGSLTNSLKLSAHAEITGNYVYNNGIPNVVEGFGFEQLWMSGKDFWET